MEKQGESESKKVHKYELMLPESIYTSTFLAVLIILDGLRNDEIGGCADACCSVLLASLTILPELSFFVLSLLCQVGLTYYLQMETEALDPCSVNVSRNLQWIGAAAFVGSMLQDIMESINMISWMLQAEAFKTDLTDVTDGMELWKRDRVCGILFVVLPKLAIAAYLSWVGTRFVLLSENNTELVLNCVAMNFVTQLDELVYATLSAQVMKKNAKHQKPVPLESEGMAVFDLVCLTPIVKPGLWAGTVAFFIHTLPQC